MEQSEIKISPYHVWWINIRPMLGIVTQHDQKVFGASITWPNKKEFNKHFACREDAVDYLVNFAKKLDKKYACRLFTDKQYSMCQEGEPIPFTSQQLSEVYYIG